MFAPAARLHRPRGCAREPLAGLLRPDNASAGASDALVSCRNLALAQLPHCRHQPVLVRSDTAAASTRLAWHLRERGVGFSLGIQIDAPVREATLAEPGAVWTRTVNGEGQPRDGAEAVELTGWIDLHTCPADTRILGRREDAHPGAQLYSPATTATL